MCKIIPYLQTYAWGKPCSQSMLSMYTENSTDHLAELWLGTTHPNGPSQWEHGLVFDMKFNFLFKILTIGNPLSIQIHPDSDLAQELHSLDPRNYPDPKAKPEMAISISDDFVAMCGYWDDSFWIENIHSLFDFDKNIVTCKDGYYHILRSSKNQIKAYVKEILVSSVHHEKIHNVFKKLVSLYGDEDVGVLSPFFLKIHNFKFGEALYIPPNTPHAYITGDIIEIMNCSDNVIRGGCTPKFCDLDNFVKCLERKTLMESYCEPKEYINDTLKEYCTPDPLLPASVLLIQGNNLVENQTSSIDFGALNICGHGVGIVLKADAPISYNNISLSQGEVWYISDFSKANISGISHDTQIALCRE